MLLWKRYGNKKMAAMRYYVLHLQQYSHRLNFFLHFLINGTIFGKMLLNMKICFRSLQLPSKIFLILRRNQRDIIVNIHGYSK